MLFKKSTVAHNEVHALVRISGVVTSANFLSCH